MRERLVAEVERAGVLGRGGAGFPLAKKLESVRAGGPRSIVVANGTEGEPASDKDKVLLLEAPHLVIDGALVAAALVGAGIVVAVVREEVLSGFHQAVAERAAASLDALPVQVVPAAPGFVAGEASAVVSWLERGVPLPRVTPPRLAERGLLCRPTLVHNVETLAHLALVARHGATWYRTLGPPDEPGTMLVTLLGHVDRPGVCEVTIGTPLRHALGTGGARLDELAAVLVGGYSGAWVRAQDACRVDLSRSSLRPLGASPGAGVLAALPRSRCGLVETSRVLSYLAAESAGQCGPCRFGLGAVAGAFERLATAGEGELGLVRRWLEQIDGRGACAHPDGAVRLARSALRVFADEVDGHRSGWCRGTSSVPVLPVPGR